MYISRIIEQRFGVSLLMLHDKIYKGTNGWIGHHIPGGLPSLLLHTVGAKTGQQRTTTLVYARDAERYLVVASKKGDPKSPGWYHNLKANPNIEINVGPKRFKVAAEPQLPGDPDYTRLWDLVNKNNADRYEGYQRRTTRPIPIVVLTPLEQLLGEQEVGSGRD